jgi:hypothetical protein
MPHNCPACGARHRYGWIFPHTCGHNGCQHECEIVDDFAEMLG